MSLNVRIEKLNNWEVVFFNGQIDEDAEVTLEDLKGKIGKSCVFNLKNIQSVNSCGVRAWINFMREAGKNSQIIFEECTPEVVGQINMIPNFKGSAQIRSVYASYTCDNCDKQHLILFKDGENLPTSSAQKIPQANCPKCLEVMEMEELEEEFFGWIEHKQ